MCILVLQLLWLQLSQNKMDQSQYSQRIQLKQRHLHRMKNLTCTSIQDYIDLLRHQSHEAKGIKFTNDVAGTKKKEKRSSIIQQQRGKF